MMVLWIKADSIQIRCQMIFFGVIFHCFGKLVRYFTRMEPTGKQSCESTLNQSLDMIFEVREAVVHDAGIIAYAG